MARFKKWKRAKSYNSRIEYFQLEKDFLFAKYFDSLTPSYSKLERYKVLNAIDFQLLLLKDLIENNDEKPVVVPRFINELKERFSNRKQAFESVKYKNLLSSCLTPEISIEKSLSSILNKLTIEQMESIGFRWSSLDEISKDDLPELLICFEKLAKLLPDQKDWSSDVVIINDYKEWLTDDSNLIYLKESCALKVFLENAILIDIIYNEMESTFNKVTDIQSAYIKSTLTQIEKLEDFASENFTFIDRNQDLLHLMLIQYDLLNGHFELMKLLNKHDSNFPAQDQQMQFFGWERNLDDDKLGYSLYSYFKDLDLVGEKAIVHTFPYEFMQAALLEGVENIICSRDKGYSEKLVFLFEIFETVGIIPSSDFLFGVKGGKDDLREDSQGEYREYARKETAKFLQLFYRP